MRLLRRHSSSCSDDKATIDWGRIRSAFPVRLSRSNCRKDDICSVSVSNRFWCNSSVCKSMHLDISSGRVDIKFADRNNSFKHVSIPTELDISEIQLFDISKCFSWTSEYNSSGRLDILLFRSFKMLRSVSWDIDGDMLVNSLNEKSALERGFISQNFSSSSRRDSTS